MTLLVVRFGALDLFFGGVQAALAAGARHPGTGDPRLAVWRSAREARLALARSPSVPSSGCGASTAPDLFLVQRSGARAPRR